MLLPIVFGIMELGRNFDVNTGLTSMYIYDIDEITKHQITIPKDFTKTQYRILESSEDVNNFLNVDGELSIKIKNGDIDIGGEGEYLKRNIDKENSVEMLIDVYHEMSVSTFPSYIPVRKDWQHLPQESVGTHYVRSIVYGGRLLLSYRIQANNKENMETIKAAVHANLQFSGSFDLGVKGKLNKLNKEIGAMSSYDINAYATVDVPFEQPTTIDQLFDLAENYPKMIKEFSLRRGAGSPLKVELVPLSTIQPDYHDYVKQRALEGILNTASDKLDDLRAVGEVWEAWLDDNAPRMNEEQTQMATDFETRFEKATEVLGEAISNLDPTKGPEQFDEAFHIYGQGPENTPNRYFRDFMRIKADVEQKPFLWFPFTKAVTNYIRWGNTTCSLPSSEPIFVGYAATTSGHGNGGNLECLRSHDPALETTMLNKVKSDETVISVINGVTYELPQKSGQVFCAFCVLENATSTFVVTGSQYCPSETKLEYAGYLMLHNKAGAVNSPICLDQNPVDKLPDEYVPNIRDSHLEPLVPYWIECPECVTVREKFLPCAVCSR